VGSVVLLAIGYPPEAQAGGKGMTLPRLKRYGKKSAIGFRVAAPPRPDEFSPSASAMVPGCLLRRTCSHSAVSTTLASGTAASLGSLDDSPHSFCVLSSLFYRKYGRQENEDAQLS
jgi:hypothetical protein